MNHAQLLFETKRFKELVLDTSTLLESKRYLSQEEGVAVFVISQALLLLEEKGITPYLNELQSNGFVTFSILAGLEEHMGLLWNYHNKYKHLPAIQEVSATFSTIELEHSKINDSTIL